MGKDGRDDDGMGEFSRSFLRLRLSEGAFLLSFCKKTKGWYKTMKTAKSTALSLILALIAILALVSCGHSVKREGLWEKADYVSDTAFGSGKTKIKVEVKAGDESVTFTVKTDKTVLGDALLEHDLIAGSVEEYGLYVKTVNGILADYDIDQSYWSLSKNGEALMTGVDGTPIADGEHYELVYTK